MSSMEYMECWKKFFCNPMKYPNTCLAGILLIGIIICTLICWKLIGWMFCGDRGLIKIFIVLIIAWLGTFLFDVCEKEVNDAVVVVTVEWTDVN